MKVKLHDVEIEEDDFDIVVRTGQDGKLEASIFCDDIIVITLNSDDTRRLNSALSVAFNMMQKTTSCVEEKTSCGH